MKQTMTPTKSFLTLSGLFIMISVFSGCSTYINISEYINKNAPLNLTINKKDNTTGLTTSNHFEIAIHSDKYQKLIEWGNNNTDGWQWAPASYIADIYVRQGDFRLLYTSVNKGVVIGFTDKEGKSKQYSKTIINGDLDFLYN